MKGASYPAGGEKGGKGGERRFSRLTYLEGALGKKT